MYLCPYINRSSYTALEPLIYLGLLLAQMIGASVSFSNLYRAIAQTTVLIAATTTRRISTQRTVALTL